jgi:hypothetical protein
MHEDKRMYFIRNIEKLEKKEVKTHTAEYEMIIDLPTVGRCDYGPYSFMIWEHSEKKSGEQRKLILRIKEKAFSEDDKPWESATKKGYYHGGGIPSELISLASLFLRKRFILGSMVRSNDMPMLYSVKEWIDKQLIENSCNLADLETLFKLVEYLKPKYHQKFILAVKSYHTAIQVIEEKPDMAYLNLVSAIEVLCQKTEIKKQLYKVNSKLANLIKNIEDEEFKDEIENAVLQKERFIKQKFQKFILEHIEESFWNYEKRPQLGKIKHDDLPKLLNNIYDQRSKTLHNGEPFPYYIYHSPTMGSELNPSLATTVGEKKWLRKDFIPYPHFFERLVRHVLINFLKKNQIKNKKPNKIQQEKSNGK